MCFTTCAFVWRGRLAYTTICDKSDCFGSTLLFLFVEPIYGWSTRGNQFFFNFERMLYWYEMKAYIFKNLFLSYFFYFFLGWRALLPSGDQNDSRLATFWKYGCTISQLIRNDCPIGRHCPQKLGKIPTSPLINLWITWKVHIICYQSKVLLLKQCRKNIFFFCLLQFRALNSPPPLRKCGSGAILSELINIYLT